MTEEKRTLPDKVTVAKDKNQSESDTGIDTSLDTDLETSPQKSSGPEAQGVPVDLDRDVAVSPTPPGSIKGTPDNQTTRTRPR